MALTTTILTVLVVLAVSQTAWAGLKFTPLGLKYKVACLAEHLKVSKKLKLFSRVELSEETRANQSDPKALFKIVKLASLVK